MRTVLSLGACGAASRDRSPVLMFIRTNSNVVVIASLAITMMTVPGWAGWMFALDSAKGSEPHDVTLETGTYRGRNTIRVMPRVPTDAAFADAKNGEGGGVVVMPGVTFHDGTIEVEVTGMLRAGAPGFVGVAFRAGTDPSKYECFHFPPTNGRADDQLRCNHWTQYLSLPEYEWARLHKETPGE